MAGVLHPRRTERVLDNALARGLTSIEALNRVTGELAAPGRPGSALMRRLVRQQDVGGDEWVGRVDFLDREKRLVVEVDSDLHHSSLVDEAADAVRDAALAQAGYTVVRIDEHDLWHRPDEVVRRLLAA